MFLKALTFFTFSLCHSFAADNLHDDIAITLKKQTVTYAQSGAIQIASGLFLAGVCKNSLLTTPEITIDSQQIDDRNQGWTFYKFKNGYQYYIPSCFHSYDVPNMTSTNPITMGDILFPEDYTGYGFLAGWGLVFSGAVDLGKSCFYGAKWFQHHRAMNSHLKTN